MKAKLKAILKLITAKQYAVYTVQKDGIYVDSTDLKIGQFIAIHKYNESLLEISAMQEDAVNAARLIVNNQL